MSSTNGIKLPNLAANIYVIFNVNERILCVFITQTIYDN